MLESLASTLKFSTTLVNINGLNHYFPFDSLFQPQLRPNEFFSLVINPLLTSKTKKLWSGKRYEHKQEHDLKLNFKKYLHLGHKDKYNYTIVPFQLQH